MKIDRDFSGRRTRSSGEWSISVKGNRTVPSNIINSTRILLGHNVCDGYPSVLIFSDDESDDVYFGKTGSIFTA